MRKLAISLLFACAACSTGAQSPAQAPATPAAPKAQSAPLEQIRALIGAAGCTDSSQCHSLAIGARACGGPQGYLAWSSAQTSGDALGPLAQRYKAERQAQITASGELSDCRFAADPGAVCRAGTCQLNAANGAPVAR